MQLSIKAIQDLRAELIKVYGTDFDFDDVALNEIGLLLLTTLSEALKLNKPVI